MKHFKFLGITISLIFVFTNKAYTETWNCGPATDGVYSDSVKCTYDEATKTLTISGEGPMGNYHSVVVDGKTASDAPWIKKDIVHAVVEKGVTTIGNRVFKALYNLEDVTGLENITSIGDRAFYNASSLTSVDLPNVQEIGTNAFIGTSSLEFAGIPTNVTWKSDAFSGSKIPNCKTGECGSCGDKFVQAGVGCVNDCYVGYYPTNQGYCKIIKLRYTLPEADAATSNDNENMIEWIFE
ncbi:MAG: leucine-rich repeat domain-containing protein [Alphaproteobacteria bacterium]|nr:leucine-rich repeat domain-containing protein [Alphaproteobacteria bacterium]